MKKILIIEDEFITALSLKKLLTDNRYDVIGIAKSAEEAYKYISENGNDPNLIITDIKIKGKIDGISFIKDIQQNKNIDIPVLYMTSYTYDSLEERINDTEYVEILNKPVIENYLIKVINRSLYHKKEFQKI